MVKTQFSCALGFTLMAGIVRTVPTSVPIAVAGFPDAAAFASKQLAVVMVKLVATVSVIVTALPVVVTKMGGAVVGDGVPAEEVVIAGGVVAKFVDVKVKGPPAEPVVVFCTATVAAATFTELVKVQVIWAAATTLAAGMVSTLLASVPKLAGFPVTAALASVQLAALAVKFVAGVSVMVTAVFKAVTLIAVGVAGVAVATLVVVIAVGVEARLVCAKVNGPPTAPAVIFCRANVAGMAVLVKVHAMASP